MEASNAAGIREGILPADTTFTTKDNRKSITFHDKVTWFLVYTKDFWQNCVMFEPTVSTNTIQV